MAPRSSWRRPGRPEAEWGERLAFLANNLFFMLKNRPCRSAQVESRGEAGAGIVQVKIIGRNDGLNVVMPMVPWLASWLLAKL